jgi:hypothetical protein
MNLPNAHEIVVAPGNFFTPVGQPFSTAENWAARRERMKRSSPFATRSNSCSITSLAARMPICARKRRAVASPPARSSCLALGPTAKKFLWPCLAALLVGKTLSYLVELCAVILFLLR